MAVVGFVVTEQFGEEVTDESADLVFGLPQSPRGDEYISKAMAAIGADEFIGAAETASISLT